MQLLSNLKERLWKRSKKATFIINIIGTINLTRLLAPYMVKRGKGHFVVMSSAAGNCPAPGQAMHFASKHPLNGYFHTLHSEIQISVSMALFPRFISAYFPHLMHFSDILSLALSCL